MPSAVALTAFIVALVVALSSSMPAANAQQQQQPSRSSPPPSPAPQTARQNLSVVVRDAETLRAALDDDDVSEILLASAGRNVDLANAGAFPAEGPPAVVGPGRTLVVRSADRASPASLNFTGGPTPAIVVARDAALVFSQILLTSAKPPSAAEAKAPAKGIAESFAAPELGMWPSISLEPGSEVRRGEGGAGAGFGEGEKRRGEKRRERQGRRRYRLSSLNPLFP